MARASTRTLLPLDRFAALCGIHPLLFNQVTLESMAEQAQISGSNNRCFAPFVQWAWQNADAVGREEIAQAIAEAEARLAQYLHFPVAPSWIIDEWHTMPLPSDPVGWSRYGTPRGDWLPVQLDQGYVLSGGVEATSLIQAGAAIVYTDVDSDLYFETATITVATTVTEPTEIALIYPGMNGDLTWEVRPISVSIAAGVATITCRREQLVLADKLTPMIPVGVMGTVDANFLTTVDVYRHYNDPQSQAEFVWYNVPCQASAGVYTTQTGVLLTRDALLGLVAGQPATWDGTSAFTATCYSECRFPDAIRFWYHAGYPRGPFGRTTQIGQLDPIWERAVTYFALALLDRPLCGCAGIEAQVQRWREDLAARRTTRGESLSYADAKNLQNPFGTWRGAIYAWEQVKNFTVPVGVPGR